MSISGMHAQIQFNTLLMASLRNEVSDITNQIGYAMDKSTAISEQYSSDLQDLADKYGEDSEAYQNLKQSLDGKYDTNLASINDWETELTTKKDEDTATIKYVEAQQEDLKSAEKTRVKSSFKYGPSS